MAEQSIDRVILNRMANEMGTLKARVIQVEAYNEVLIKQLKELELQLEKTECVEGDEENVDND